ncbi:MAG: DHH family phosphoesterase [Candidatus Cloacimonetes bacterium]|nr:DHH family phosphoesterase [Candidatus Cloacimonadota bacterium]
MPSEQQNDNVPKPDLLSSLLVARGFTEEVLDATIDNLPDEALFANISTVAERIQKAMYSNEPMVIFGHDDPDGITSSYILYRFLESCGYQKHNYYIPNRNLEPHGIQAGFIDFVKEGGYKLVITVDNGISAKDGVEKLNALGCDVIVTDHHIVQADTLPSAYTIMNPQLKECQYPFKPLAGVGVALMLVRYLGRVWEHPIDPASYFWAAVGSIADKVPMIGINRIIVRHAMENFSEVQDETVEFLLRNYKRMNTFTDIFNFMQYTARMIANGREANGQHTALRFILQISDAKAKLFQDLEKQRNVWEGELNRVFSFLDTLSAGFIGNYFVYFDDDDVIPYSLLGTAATYIVNKLRIPTIMLKHHNGDTVCEGRCSDGFNIVNAFSHCKSHLKQFGGHPKAAGFTMNPAQYDAFLECFNDYLVQNWITADSDEFAWEVEVKLDEITTDNWSRLEVLLPWGQMNSEPLIKICNVSRRRLADSLCIDHAGVDIPHTGTGDAVALWKSSGMIKVLHWQEHSPTH